MRKDYKKWLDYQSVLRVESKEVFRLLDYVQDEEITEKKTNYVIYDVFLTSEYLNNLKLLRKKHDTKTLNKLRSVLNDLLNYKKPTSKYNYQLKNSQYMHIHISNDLSLVYKYIQGTNTIVLNLELNSIQNHKDLKRNSNNLNNAIKEKITTNNMNETDKKKIGLIDSWHSIHIKDLLTFDELLVLITNILGDVYFDIIQNNHLIFVNNITSKDYLTLSKNIEL